MWTKARIFNSNFPQLMFLTKSTDSPRVNLLWTFSLHHKTGMELWIFILHFIINFLCVILKSNTEILDLWKESSERMENLFFGPYLCLCITNGNLFVVNQEYRMSVFWKNATLHRTLKGWEKASEWKTNEFYKTIPNSWKSFYKYFIYTWTFVDVVAPENRVE